MRSLNMPGNVKAHLRLKQRQRGLDEATYVESFLVLNALGGDCLEDFDRLREDLGLREMLGHEVPRPEAARKFLYQFHDEEKLEKAQRELPVGRLSYIPAESTALRGLAQVNEDLVREIGQPLPRAEDRDHRSGCDGDRKLQTRGAEDVRGDQRVSADAGVMGGDGLGGGR